jgi:hypothetical protein
VVLPAYAETDPQTVQFLEKLNLYSYCLSREGLKNFTCDLKLTLSNSIKVKMGENNMTPKYRKFFNNLRFSLSETSAGESEIKLITPMPSGDPVQDAYVAKKMGYFQSAVKNLIKTWAETELKPSFDQESYDHGCKVIKDTNGFDVEETNKDGYLTVHYDSQAKVTSMAGLMNGENMEMTPELMPSPKGFVLTGLNLKSDHLSAHLIIDHQKVSKFRMPQKITAEMNVPGVLVGAFSLYFSNYRLNQ